jgi:hypothetical protein
MLVAHMTGRRGRCASAGEALEILEHRSVDEHRVARRSCRREERRRETVQPRAWPRPKPSLSRGLEKGANSEPRVEERRVEEPWEGALVAGPDVARGPVMTTE